MLETFYGWPLCTGSSYNVGRDTLGREAIPKQCCGRRDKVVTAAFEELKINEQALTELGEPIKIEQCVGAGVQPNGDVKVRVFIIFTKSGGASSYSCNVSATGKPIEGGGVEIIKLSCAKDEGWGRTIDVI